MAVTVSEVERLFSLLLSPDTNIIRQATAELRSVYKNPALLGVLCHVILHCEDPHIRQLSAVVLRKKLVHVWKRLTTEDKESFKNVLIEVLGSEMHHLVLKSTANLVSVIANYELTHSRWPELSQFIMKYCQSDDSAQQEIGMLVLSCVMESAALQLHPQFIQLLGLFSSALGNIKSKMVPFYALKSLTVIVEYLGEDEMPHFRSLIPKAILAIKTLIDIDEDKACEAMELFDELMECDINLISPFLQQLVEFCLEIGRNTSLDDTIRVKSLSTLGFLITLKKKSLLKLGLLPSILDTVLCIMVSLQEEETDDPLIDESTKSPHSEASRVLDRMALSLPPEKLFISVLQYMRIWLGNDSTLIQRRTALTVIGVMAEGCAEHIRTKHLRDLVQLIFSGLTSNEQSIKNAALFALGQFSEHLQPDITQYSAELLPALFTSLDQSLSSNGPSITRIFYALETFCENLGVDLVPYLSGLMEKLFILLTGEYNIEYKELAISCVGAIANAVGEQLAPYFPRLLEVLKNYIHLPYEQDLVVLQAQAVDTLGIMAKTVGVVTFSSIAEECLILGLSLMNSQDPDLRRSVYGMIASLSTVLGNSLVPHLTTIIPKMIESLQSDEGVKAYYSSLAVPFLDFDDDDDDSTGKDESIDESLEDDQDIEGYTVENAYIEEKEDACNAIGEIAENVGVHFLSFIDNCFQEISAHSDDTSPGLRKAVYTSLGRLCTVWYKCMEQMNQDDKSSLVILINATLSNMSASARTDADSLVTVATLESIELVLKCLKGSGFKLEEKVVTSLLVTIEDIFNNKAQCQEEDGDEGLFNNDITEMEGLLLESAGSLLGPLASVVGGDIILKLLNPILAHLIGKLNLSDTIANKSFVIGTLAEIIDGCGPSCTAITKDMYPLFMSGLSDKSDEVVSNSVYGLGVLAYNDTAYMTDYYHDILQVLFSLAHTRCNGRLMDNICATVSRMITRSPQHVPLEQVLPVLLQNVPLKEDFEEIPTVYNCMFNLLQSCDQTIMNNLDLVLKAFASDLSPSSKLSQELQAQVITLINALSVQCPQQFEAAIGCLPPTHTQVIAHVLQSKSNN